MLKKQAMKKFRTHYDNLKISRDAPDYVIRAAYKAMVQKYHPDKNPGDSRANKILSIINDSYAVLSDPIKRKQHDEWILRKEEELKAAESNSSEFFHKQKNAYDNQNTSSASVNDSRTDESRKSSDNKVSNSKIFEKYLRLFIFAAVLFLITKYFGTIIGLTVVAAYLVWTKIGAEKIWLRLVLTVSVVLVGTIIWFKITVSYYEMFDGLRNKRLDKTEAVMVDRNTNIASEVNKNISTSKSEVAGLKRPAWLKPSKSDDELIQTTIGNFTKVTVDSWNMRMGINLNGKPVLNKIFSGDALRAYLVAAIDFNDNVILIFGTGTGGNCSSCSMSYAALFNSSGDEMSVTEIPADFLEEKNWKYIDGKFNSITTAINGKLFDAVMSNDGIMIAPHNTVHAEAAPAELCSGLYLQLSGFCTNISKNDCNKVSYSDVNTTMMDLKSRLEPNRTAWSTYSQSWMRAGNEDPRINFNKFKKICENYCLDIEYEISKSEFEAGVCNIN